MGQNADYVASRILAGKKPLTFRLTSVTAIDNTLLLARFQRECKRLEALGRTADELKPRTGFHGTRSANVPKIAASGLLRVGHPQNPSQRTDKGWFGSPEHGVYLSRYATYALKYANDQAPLQPGEEVALLMFRLVVGRVYHLPHVTPGVMPTAGYDSHSSANHLEYYLFAEPMCVPTHILAVRAFEDTRTDADDKVLATATATAAAATAAAGGVDSKTAAADASASAPTDRGAEQVDFLTPSSVAADDRTPAPAPAASDIALTAAAVLQPVHVLPAPASALVANAKALFDFTGDAANNSLSFRAGDGLVIAAPQQNANGWLRAQSLSGAHGYVPVSYVQMLS